MSANQPAHRMKPVSPDWWTGRCTGRYAHPSRRRTITAHDAALLHPDLPIEWFDKHVN
jgi:hypothetical protein